MCEVHGPYCWKHQPSTEVLKLECASEARGGCVTTVVTTLINLYNCYNQLLQHWLLGPAPRVSNSVSLPWSPRIFIFNKFSDAAPVAATGDQNFENQWPMKTQKEYLFKKLLAKKIGLFFKEGKKINGHLLSIYRRRSLAEWNDIYFILVIFSFIYVFYRWEIQRLGQLLPC